jgi:hypothetical protein
MTIVTGMLKQSVTTTKNNLHNFENSYVQIIKNIVE